MTFRWAIFGTGTISAKFISGLAHAKDAKAVMVASRTQERASRFAQATGIDQAVAGYGEAAKSGGIDVAYIATPPSEHLSHAMMCLEAGVPVLVEKPFAADAASARRLADAARASGTFCMEGMWTRFLPASQKLRAIVSNGGLGDIRQATGSFGFSNEIDIGSSSFDPGRGGGALAQLGIYPVSLMQWLFGSPIKVTAIGTMGETGVEEDAAIILNYANQVIATIHTSLRTNAANQLSVLGTHGSVSTVGPIFRPIGLNILQTTPRRKPVDQLPGRKAALREGGFAQRLNQWNGILRPNGKFKRLFYTGNGYHYEADEVRRCVEAGLTESPVMPLDDSISVAQTLDDIRVAIRNQNGTAHD